MNTIGQIWNIIVTSNFFNFVVMVLILAWIVTKFDLINVLENIKINIQNTIKKAEEEKAAAEKELINAKKSVEKLILQKNKLKKLRKILHLKQKKK